MLKFVSNTNVLSAFRACLSGRKTLDRVEIAGVMTTKRDVIQPVQVSTIEIVGNEWIMAGEPVGDGALVARNQRREIVMRIGLARTRIGHCIEARVAQRSLEDELIAGRAEGWTWTRSDGISGHANGRSSGGAAGRTNGRRCALGCGIGLRVGNQRAAISVAGKIERALEIIERKARAIDAVGYRKQAGGCIIAFGEVQRIIIDPGEIDRIGMGGIGRGSGKSKDKSAEAARLVEDKRAGAPSKSYRRANGNRRV